MVTIYGYYGGEEKSGREKGINSPALKRSFANNFSSEPILLHESTENLLYTLHSKYMYGNYTKP
jgi:hypothetical protein